MIFLNKKIKFYIQQNPYTRTSAVIVFYIYSETPYYSKTGNLGILPYRNNFWIAF